MSEELVLLEHEGLSQERGEPVRQMQTRKKAEILKKSGWKEIAFGPDPDDAPRETFSFSGLSEGMNETVSESVDDEDDEVEEE